MRNPFTPSFGSVPPVMAGREQLLDDMRQAFENGSGDPNLSTIIVGARGTGKTALLSALSEEAGLAGWVTASVTALPGILEDILVRTVQGAAHLLDDGTGIRIKSIEIPKVASIEIGRAPSPSNWRSDMESLIMQLEEHGSGLLITVDEVNPSVDEMIRLAAVYQHFVREGRSVALVMAGLPAMVSELISNETVSFLRRARRHHFGSIPRSDIETALKTTVEAAGRTIGQESLDKAADAIDGFPYMMQLVGYEAWRQSPDNPEITETDIDKGIVLARREMRDHILATTYREFSRKDIEFLEAMTEDRLESRLSDIADRMGVKSNYASQYKRRLLEQGAIREPAKGIVAFEIPGLREYVIERM